MKERKKKEGKKKKKKDGEKRALEAVHFRSHKDLDMPLCKYRGARECWIAPKTKQRSEEKEEEKKRRRKKKDDQSLTLAEISAGLTPSLPLILKVGELGRQHAHRKAEGEEKNKKKKQKNKKKKKKKAKKSKKRKNATPTAWHTALGD
jgi:hypothetical protein